MIILILNMSQSCIPRVSPTGFSLEISVKDVYEISLPQCNLHLGISEISWLKWVKYSFCFYFLEENWYTFLSSACFTFEAGSHYRALAGLEPST